MLRSSIIFVDLHVLVIFGIEPGRSICGVSHGSPTFLLLVQFYLARSSHENKHFSSVTFKMPLCGIPEVCVDYFEVRISD